MTSGEIETGKRLMQSPITDTVYLVTRWEDLGDGQYRALEKEAVPEDLQWDNIEWL